MLYILLITIAVLFGLCRGVTEGLVMAKRTDILYSTLENGIRGHRWFRYYHTLDIATYLLFGIGFHIIFVTNIPFLFVLGLIILNWELFELTYSYTRFKEWINYAEHITCFDVTLIIFTKNYIWFLHILRIISAIVFLIIGLQ